MDCWNNSHLLGGRLNDRIALSSSFLNQRPSLEEDSVFEAPSDTMLHDQNLGARTEMMTSSSEGSVAAVFPFLERSQAGADYSLVSFITRGTEAQQIRNLFLPAAPVFAGSLELRNQSLHDMIEDALEISLDSEEEYTASFAPRPCPLPRSPSVWKRHRHNNHHRRYNEDQEPPLLQ